MTIEFSEKRRGHYKAICLQFSHNLQLQPYPDVHDDVRGTLLDGERVVEGRLVIWVAPAAAPVTGLVTQTAAQLWRPTTAGQVRSAGDGLKGVGRVKGIGRRGVGWKSVESKGGGSCERPGSCEKRSINTELGGKGSVRYDRQAKGIRPGHEKC